MMTAANVTTTATVTIPAAIYKAACMQLLGGQAFTVGGESIEADGRKRAGVVKALVAAGYIAAAGVEYGKQMYAVDAGRVCATITPVKPTLATFFHMETALERAHLGEQFIKGIGHQVRPMAVATNDFVANQEWECLVYIALHRIEYQFAYVNRNGAFCPTVGYDRDAYAACGENGGQLYICDEALAAACRACVTAYVQRQMETTSYGAKVAAELLGLDPATVAGAGGRSPFGSSSKLVLKLDGGLAAQLAADVANLRARLAATQAALEATLVAQAKLQSFPGGEAALAEAVQTEGLEAYRALFGSILG